MSKTSCDLSRHLGLGAIFFRESNATVIFRQVKAARSSGLAISAWTLTEMASGGAIKVRTGTIDLATRQQALTTFHRFVSSNLNLVEVEPADFRSAAALIEVPGGLRAGDALHLALAKRLSANLATLDRRLADAAPHSGVSLLPVG